MFLLSINQKIIVKPITDNNGINSAQNLQTAALFVSGIGKIETHIAQPTKKANVFYAFRLYSYFYYFWIF